MSDQLDRIHALADERRENEGLYNFEREYGQTFVSVMAALLGQGSIPDDDLDRAIAWVREQDAQAVAKRAAS